MRADLLAELIAESEARRASILVTDVATGAQKLVREGEIAGDPLASQLEAHLRLGKSALIETPDKTSVFLHVRVPRLRMIVLGAVRIAQALVPIAELVGFEVIVIDPRPTFATRERFPDCAVIAQSPQEVFAARPLDRYTAMVVLSHDADIDDAGITAALAGGCYYVGALGSRKTSAKRLERLRAQNIPEAALASIHAPIGLDIGAVSAVEIAVAIIAEVIAARRQKPPRAEAMA
ncbi:XdhC/CoxF family protein [Methylovirgula ligni]|uniref:Putative sulfurylase large subunit (Molybdopterin cytosine dinucleotide biosynthesis) n=1 Tax=Methylovirgula ligni TaxID=569860 RepID=A0A3D9Z1J2_9HYPH|nr:XdhC family protein [Methylovirgula ligni]QAY97056.1 XdhC/CoxF family protein [Methylovirgula ligni]REF87870.1 putative sulfurylase large subunit (molybdopterin cytosine dinucleotide biosynthesis) [Methylovirgula ligni]